MPTTQPSEIDSAAPARALRTAVLLAVGSELTVGETRDTNSGDLARSLSGHGVEVVRISALPDRLEIVVDALREGLAAADFVVTTGGLGPTPDDLTREAIAAVTGERPAINPHLETWLRHLFERRGIKFHDTNLKQAWLIPSATAIPNKHGTAPGWWVDRPDGGVVVALPGPPSEMRPMWDEWVLPKLTARGLGREYVTKTLRLTGIGESAVAALLGEELLRAENPVVATYARQDAVDVRISAHAAGGRLPADLAAQAEATVMAAVGDHVWGYGDDTWPIVLGRELESRGWTVALAEVGTGGATMRLLGDAPWLAAARVLSAADADAPTARLAEQAARTSPATVGLAVRAVESGEDTSVEVAACGPWGARESRTTAFLGGSDGRRRAGIAAAALLHEVLRDQPRPAAPERR
jgi:nicotinamide-nucleotide amidase